MKNIFVIFFLFLLSSYNLTLAQVKLNGKVFDAETKNPVVGALVNVLNTSTVTDERGFFILIVPSVQGQLNIKSIGNKTITVSLSDFLKTDGTIYIKSQAIELKELVLNNSIDNQYQSIGQLDIQSREPSNSQEILRLVPGLFIGQHAGGGKAEQIFMRGFDIDHGTDVNIAVDGMTVNMVSHAHGQGYADLHFLIPETVDKVSFKKGAYDASKGDFATSGAVEFKTFDTLPNNNLKLEAGMFDTYRVVGMANLLGNNSKVENKNAYIASEYQFTNGYFDSPQNFNRINIFGKYNQLINAKNKLTFSASTFSSKWNASGQIPDRAVADGSIGYFGAIDPNEGGKTSRTNASLSLLSSIKDLAYLKNQVYYANYQFELYSNFTFFKNDPLNGDQIKQKENRNLVGYNGSLNHTKIIGNNRLMSTFGLNVRMDFTKDSELSSTKDRATTLNMIMLGDISQKNLSAYIDETFLLGSKFSVNAGLRYDYFKNEYLDKLGTPTTNSADAAILSPKLNFSYHINKNTTLYLNSGKGFHSNDTRVVVPQNGVDILPPSYGSDLGLTLKPSNSLLLNFALWYLWLDQELVYVGDESIVELSGKTQRYGLDFSLRYQPIKWLNLDADINYAHARSLASPKTENYLPLAPKLTSIGGALINFNSKINGSLRYRYMGNRPANEDNSLIAKGYLVTDAQVSYTKSKFQLGALVQNLFNVKWKETQFETESQLRNEVAPVSEIHFTPGTPLAAKIFLSYSI